MEAKPNGFSIRDFTLKMRSVNIFKCWPFPIDNLTREEIESRLPEMITSNPTRRYETDNPPTEAFESTNQRESVESERSFSGVDAMKAQPMMEKQQQIKMVRTKASRRRTLTEIFNLDVVGEEKLSSIVSPSKKPDFPSQLVPPLLESVSLPVQQYQPLIENSLDVILLDVDKYENTNKNKINCGLQAERFSKDLANFREEKSKSAEEESIHETRCSDQEKALDVGVKDCPNKYYTEEQQHMMSPSLSSKPKPQKMRSLARISKQLDVVCEVNEEESHKSSNRKNKIAFKMGRRRVPPLNYKREKMKTTSERKNSMLTKEFITTKSHAIKKSKEESQKIGKREDNLIMKVGKHWVLPQKKKMSKKNISFEEGIME